MMMKIFADKKGLSPIGILGEILIVLAVIIILLAIVIVPRIFTQSDIVGGQIGGKSIELSQRGCISPFTH